MRFTFSSILLYQFLQRFYSISNENSIVCVAVVTLYSLNTEKIMQRTYTYYSNNHRVLVGFGIFCIISLYYYHHQTLLFSVSISFYSYSKSDVVVCSVACCLLPEALNYYYYYRTYFVLEFIDSFDFSCIGNIFRLWFSKVEIFPIAISKLQSWAMRRISNMIMLLNRESAIVKLTEKLFFSKKIECYEGKKKKGKYILECKGMNQMQQHLNHQKLILWTCPVEYYYRIICSIPLNCSFLMPYALYSKLNEAIQCNQGLMPDNVNVFHTDIFQFI